MQYSDTPAGRIQAALGIGPAADLTARALEIQTEVNLSHLHTFGTPSGMSFESALRAAEAEQRTVVRFDGEAAELATMAKRAWWNVKVGEDEDVEAARDRMNADIAALAPASGMLAGGI